MTFGFLVGSKNFCKLFCVLRSFCFARIRLDPLGGKVLYNCSVAMIMSRLTSFAKNFVIGCCQVTKIFCTKYDSAKTSSARGPRDLGPQADLAISVLRQVTKMLCLPDTTFCSRLWSNSWEKLEASRCSGTLSSARLSLNSSSHSGRSCDEFPRTSSLILSHLTDAGCSVGVTVSCDENVGEVGEDELEELVDRPSKNEWYVVGRFAIDLSAMFDELWFLTTGPMVITPVIFAEFSKWEKCRCIFKKHYCHEYNQFFVIHCCFFFCLHLAVGCYHRRRTFRDPYGFQFGWIQIFPVDHMHACSGVHHKLSVLLLYCGCGRRNPLIGQSPPGDLSSNFRA